MKKVALSLLLCLSGWFTHSALAAEDAPKKPAAPTAAATAAPMPAPGVAPAAKPNEATGKISAPEPKSAEHPKPKSFSNPDRDLTHCLNREGNTEIIKCTE